VPVVFVAGLFGLLVGSFLNVVIHRLPRGESLVWPGSRCPRCGRPIRPHENVPVLSWLALRARCRGCGGRISARYPAVELGTALVFAALAARFGPAPELALWMVFSAGLAAAALIDVDHGIIPDELSLGGLAVGLVLVPGAALLAGSDPRAALVRALAGALFGGGALWAVGFAHARLATALGRRFEHWPGPEGPPRRWSADWWLWFPGMGLGDVKLLAAIGAFLGPAGVLDSVLLASLLGIALGGALALRRGSLAAPFGFAPALALGALAVVLLPQGPLAWLGLR
jgi:leader peptidase (prepilin peptidase)/N-methyltransferase